MEKKTEVNAYLIENSKGEVGKSHSQAVGTGLGGVLWMYKVGLKLPVIAMAHCQKPV